MFPRVLGHKHVPYLMCYGWYRQGNISFLVFQIILALVILLPTLCSLEPFSGFSQLLSLADPEQTPPERQK